MEQAALIRSILHLFLSGALRLTEGCHVTEGNGGIILYEGLAEKYGLSLGDTLRS